MRIFRRFIIPLIVVLVVNLLLQFCLTPPSYIRNALHEVQQSDVNYDVILLGQSHGEYAFNPYRIEEKTGMTTYNLSRKLLCVRDLAYLLKESNYKNKPKYVILDIDSTYWMGADVPNYFADAYIYPNLHNPVNRMEYFFKYCFHENFRYSLCRYVMFGTGDIKKIPSRIKIKLSSQYLSYDITSTMTDEEKAEYIGRGFFYAKTSGSKTFTPSVWNDKSVKKDSLDGFLDMVSYCKKNNIQLICVSSPLPKERVGQENHSECHDYFARLADENDVVFWDFNNVDPSYLSWTMDEFRDGDGHMLGTLADDYSSLLGTLLRKYQAGENINYYFTN